MRESVKAAHIEKHLPAFHASCLPERVEGTSRQPQATKRQAILAPVRARGPTALPTARGKFVLRSAPQAMLFLQRPEQQFFYSRCAPGPEHEFDESLESSEFNNGRRPHSLGVWSLEATTRSNDGRPQCARTHPATGGRAVRCMGSPVRAERKSNCRGARRSRPIL